MTTYLNLLSGNYSTSAPDEITRPGFNAGSSPLQNLLLPELSDSTAVTPLPTTGGTLVPGLGLISTLPVIGGTASEVTRPGFAGDGPVPDFNFTNLTGSGKNNLSNCLTQFTYLSQLVKQYYPAGKKQFDKALKDSYNLSALIGVNNIVISAVFNPMGITNKSQFNKKYFSLRSQLLVSLTEASQNTGVGPSQVQALLGKWRAWDNTFKVTIGPNVY